MTSSMVSRLLQGGSGSPSTYDTLRKQDEDSEASDLEERAGMVVDEEHLREPFHDLDLDNAPINAGQRSTKSPRRPSPLQDVSGSRLKKSKRMSRPRWMPESHKLLDVEEADDEVPASLLIEGAGQGAQRSPPQTTRGRAHDTVAIPISGPATTQAQQQWQRARARQGLHSSPRPNTTPRRRASGALAGLAQADPKEKAMWRWVNVENLDNFLNDVYLYYLGHGFWSILLHRALALLTLAFVVGFTIFLTNCIDYHSLPGSEKLSDILVPRCTRQMGGLSNFILWLVCFFWIWKFFQYLLDIRRLRILHDFYEHLLGIAEVEVQTISWQEIVSRLMALRDANPNTAGPGSGLSRRAMRNQNKQRMDAHDIANRLMRKENYMIALVNKDILDLTLPVPFLRNRQFFSRSLEWNIQLCVIDYVFNEQGQVRALFLKDTHRKALSDTLRRRFIIAGAINIFAAPFLVIYFLMHYFFRYFNEYQKNPSQIGSRQYNSLAEWKFREFNELWHLFQRRINMSYPFATRYINQFPRDKTVQAARFVAFISGALASVLALASVIDPDLFLSFQLSPDRTVLFYLGIFGTTWAVARGMLPEENLVFDPEFALSEVIEFTHYRPAPWDGRLHSDEVRAEFARLYQMKVVIFFEEILSMIFTPFILWFSLPTCSDKIIDFFREFTVHVDGLGYVCSFAEFNFKKQGNMLRQPFSRANPASAGQELTEDYYTTKDQKLEASYWGFMNDYARNPKTDVRFPYSRGRMHHRSINPPPPFPGLMSPATVPAEMNGHAVHSTARSMLGAAQYRPSPRMSGKGSIATGGAISTSPLTSILLDPHHQPSGSGFQVLGQARPRPPPPPPRRLPPPPQQQQEAPLSETGQSVSAEAEDGDEPPRELVEGPSTADLESSSRFDQDDDDDDDGEEDKDEDEDEDVGAVTGQKGGAGGGVLGLIRQFQRARGEGLGRLGSGVGGGGGIGL